MLLAWESDEVRAAEAPLLAAGVPLMDRAAFALAVWVARELRARRGRVGGARVVLLVGGGNNGGDALYAGAHLARRGAAVLAVLTSTRVHEGGLAALVAAGGRVLAARDEARHSEARDDEARDDETSVARAADEAAGADVVLDALLGIGGRGALRGAGGGLVQALRARGVGLGGGAGRDAGGPLVVAVDVPSGIGVDDGTLPGPVLAADLTVTFGGAKPGLLLPPAAAFAGRVEVVEVGLTGLAQVPPAVARLDLDDVAALWPVPGAQAQKYTRGVLGVVAGTRAYPGAAVLATGAAVRAGVGMVRYLGDVADAVLAAHPEVVVGPGRVQAWVLGPGVDEADEAQTGRVDRALDEALRAASPAVVDAGALARLPERVGPLVVLTPHAGELAALLAARGERVDRVGVEAEPLRWARRAHQLTGATVLLKGAVTIVVGPGGAVYAQADAPAWLATAGSGDVLAGLLGALLAGRAGDLADDPTLLPALAAAAACVHGLAAHVATPGGPVSASAVAEALPATIAAVLAR